METDYSTRKTEIFISGLTEYCIDMNISIEITGEILDYLESKVDEGLFKSRSEVIRAAIRDMIQKDIQYQLKEKGLTPEELKKLRDEEVGEILEEKFPELSS